MSKRTILFLIPLALIGCLLVYAWLSLLINGYIIQFQHYLGLISFIVVIYLCYEDKTLKKGILATGIYLIMGTINLVSFFPFIATGSFGITIGSVQLWAPALNFPILLVLILYFALNFNSLVDMYLDYKESKGKL